MTPPKSPDTTPVKPLPPFRLPNARKPRRGTPRNLNVDIPTTTGWRHSWNATSKEFAEETEKNKKDGFHLHDIEVYNQRGNTVISGIYHKRTDGRGWAAAWTKTYDEFTKYFNEQKEQGRRLIDIEVMEEKDDSGNPVLRYSGVWIENVEKLGWYGRWNLTRSEWEQEYVEYVEKGYRPTDIELYEFDGETYYAAVWVENTNNLDWDIIWEVSHEKYKEKFSEMTNKGFRPTDMESANINGTFVFSGIWETSPGNPD